MSDIISAFFCELHTIKVQKYKINMYALDDWLADSGVSFEDVETAER